MAFISGANYDVRIEPDGERYTVTIRDRLRHMYFEYREIADMVYMDGMTMRHVVTQLFTPLDELDELGEFTTLMTDSANTFVDRLAACLIDSTADFIIL